MMNEGRKDDSGKPRMDLVPMDAVRGAATVFAFGAKKYSDRNWEKGLTWGRLTAALLRHIGSWMTGYDYDEESKLHHLDHALCTLMMLNALVRRNIGKDDRKVEVTSQPKCMYCGCAFFARDQFQTCDIHRMYEPVITSHETKPD